MQRIHELSDSFLNHASSKNNTFDYSFRSNWLKENKISPSETSDVFNFLISEGFFVASKYGGTMRLTPKGQIFIKDGGYKALYNEQEIRELKDTERRQKEDESIELNKNLTLDQLKTNKHNRIAMWIAIIISGFALIVSILALCYSISSK